MTDELKSVPLVLSNTTELWPNTVVVASYSAVVQHDVDDKFVLMLDNKLAVAPVESKSQCHKVQIFVVHVMETVNSFLHNAYQNFIDFQIIERFDFTTL